MADVILVQPKLGDMDSVRTKPSLPLGLLHCSVLVARKYKVVLIDQRKEGWQTKLKNELKKNPLCVATTAIIGPQIKYALEISRFVKANSETKVIWGGIHASLLPRQALKNENIDVVIVGEGEISFYEAVKALEKSKELKGIKGVWYKNRKGKIISNKPRAFVDLNKLPDLPFHLVDLKEHMPLYQGKKSILVETSRGCTHECAYCYNTVFNKGCWRSLNAKKVVEQINFLAEKGAENISIVDDNFFVDLKRGKEIAKEIRKIGIDWQVQGVTPQSVKQMSNDYLRFLERSNLKRIGFGAESGSERIMRMIKKEGSVKDLIALNKRLSKFGMVVSYSFIVGFPTETDDERKETIDLLFMLLIDNKNARNSPIYNLVPIPKTKMMEMARKHGFREPQTLEGWINLRADEVNVPYIKDKEKFSRMYFSSIFIDNKFSEYNSFPLMKILSRIYRPIARFRVRNQFFKFMPEKKIADKFR